MLVAYCRLCHYCRNLAEGGCLFWRFHFTHCRYFLGHVAFRNLPWQGLSGVMQHLGPGNYTFTVLLGDYWGSLKMTVCVTFVWQNLHEGDGDEKASEAVSTRRRSRASSRDIKGKGISTKGSSFPSPDHITVSKISYVPLFLRITLSSEVPV